MSSVAGAGKKVHAANLSNCMRTPENTPVIVGVGEYTDRPEHADLALEPIAMMAKALRLACEDANTELLEKIQSIELIGTVTWRYENPVDLLCARLGIRPQYRHNTSMGGETPVRLIHDAAIRIAKGEIGVAAIVGAEAMHALKRSRKEAVTLKWTPLVSKDTAVRFASDSIAVSPISKLLGIADPTQMYPLYEVATQAAWGQTPRQGRTESATLWRRFAEVARQNPYAWIQEPPSFEDIEIPSDKNRMISWPYSKLMVANPTVNQAAAVIITSLATARAVGIPADRIVHIWGGSAASEPDNYLYRDTYDHSTAQAAVLAKAVAIAGGYASNFKHIELYSCFPIVPKMALRCLGLEGSSTIPTVTGGLTFFGGPLNNYMTHAVCAMVRTLRGKSAGLGLLYGQGGFVSKHHALVLCIEPPSVPLSLEYSVQEEADRTRGAVPELAEFYEGPATIETYTVRYGRDGEPLEGILILRTPAGARTMARVNREDDRSLALLINPEKSAVGITGNVRVDSFGKPSWTTGESSNRGRNRYTKVERRGTVTIVTINRPESMNALTPATNAELAEIFDEFAADPGQWVAIITGAGDRAFSSGNDLKFMASAMARGEDFSPPLSGYGGLTARFDLNKPVIAAVNGVAMGGGFEIALACDLIIASTTASFSLPEPRVGVAALAGGLLRLPRQIGYKHAMGMILTGRRVSAVEGRELGFVNEVVEPESLMDAALRWAASIVECSPMSIRASKQIVQQSFHEGTLDQAYRAQERHAATRALFRSSDFREGALAFSQKRVPNWKAE